MKVYLVQAYESMQVERVFTSLKKALAYLREFSRCKLIEKREWGFVGYSTDDNMNEPTYYVQIMQTR